MIKYKSSSGCNHPLGAPCVSCDALDKEGRDFNARTPSVILFRPAFYEHVSLDGVQCDTPQQLAKACKDNGNTSVYLRDFGSLWRTERREI